MSGIVVVDTSVALKWVLAESDSVTAKALLAEWDSNGITMLAPALFAYEVANALYQKARRGVIAVDEAERALAGLFAVGPTLDFSANPAIALKLGARATEFAHQFGLSATYDAHYLALAERETCDYWTADERLWNSVKAQIPWVRWLGAYTPPPSQPSAP